MRIRKILTLALALFLLAGCIAGCSSKKENIEDVYYVYFGLNDADTGKQEISMEEASLYIRSVMEKYHYGYTEHRTHGAYTENGETIENDTLVYMLIFVPEEDIKKMSDEIIDHLNLASVLCQKSEAEYTFYVGAEKQAQ